MAEIGSADGAEQPPERSGMDDSELAALLAAHEARAVGYYNSEIADEQAKAINYYYGRMDDLPALDGCSSVVDHRVAVMVDNALAAVLKPFVSAEEIVAFEPRGPEDVDQAEQAGEYVNYVINCDNPGFLVLHNWFKDALLTKIGVVKVWWEDRSRIAERIVGADAGQLLELRASEAYAGEQDNGDGSFTVKLQEVVPDGRVRIENVPPEEFLISPFARSIEEAAYVAHRPSNYTRSDLVELGVDAEIADALPAFESGRNQEARAQARYRDEEYYSGTSEAIGSDRSRDAVAVLDEYVRCDFDGDGLAELRRVIRVDDVILFNEPVEENAFALLCPVPMPHKVYGRSLADQSVEGQKVSTAVLRQTLDNLYKTNNPRPEVPDTAINDRTMDDLCDSSPGAVISTKVPGQLAYHTVPFTAQHSFAMLEYVARQTEERTGVQRKGNGLSSEAIRKNSPDTATQAAIDENSRNERAEMIARIFAETGVKRLFKLVLKLLVQHQPRERVVRLRNKWVPMDPRGWSAEMDVTISVGLGLGNKAEQIGQAQAVLGFMAQLQSTPYAWLINAGHVHSAAKRLLIASGIKNADDFIGDPTQLQPPTPQPDPKIAETQAKLRIEQARMQARIQVDAAEQQRKAAETEARLRLEQAQAEFRATLERQKAEFEAELALMESRFEMEMERERLTAQREAAAEPAGTGEVERAGDGQIELGRNRPGGKLDE